MGELYGQILVENVTLQFSEALNGRVFKENMTVEFGRVRWVNCTVRY